jgi:hypothetical protein
MASMAIPPEEFKEKIKAMVMAHYAANRTPLLLAHLGAQIEKNQLWPTDRGQRSLKQLIKDCFGTDLQIVWDKRSPAFIAVVTPDVRNDVEAQIADRLSNKDLSPVRLEEIARPVLLAFCINVQNDPVYVRRTKPFRYEIGNISADRASEYVLVEPEYRRPGLRIEHPHLLPLSERRDLEGLIQKWLAVHNLQIEQFSRQEQDESEIPDAGKTALDRLLAAQTPDVAQRLLIPADIAQILTRIR